MISAEPFLKWAGGKRQLISEIESLFPKEIKESKNIDCYIEPFVGGGAILFHLLSNYKVKKAIINDINGDLIMTYKVIKSEVNDLIKELQRIETEYLSLNETARKEYFYNNLRCEFNKRSEDGTSIKNAALMIALNKTCFNGLFRQNSKGEFNVPYGRYNNPRLVNEKNLLNVNLLLRNVEILSMSYENLPYDVEKSSLIYFDPPYRPLSNSSSFTKYSKEDFNDDDQRKLAELFKRLDRKGHHLILSNSDPTNTNKNDLFFDNLYQGYFIKRVLAKRFINSDASKRKAINELIITNF